MDYDIRTDVKFGPLEPFDAGRMAREGEKPWWNQSLCGVNDCVLRLGVLKTVVLMMEAASVVPTGD